MTTQQLKGLAEAMKEMTQLGEVGANNKDLWFKSVSPEVVIQMAERIELLEQQVQREAA